MHSKDSMLVALSRHLCLVAYLELRYGLFLRFPTVRQVTMPQPQAGTTARVPDTCSKVPTHDMLSLIHI